MRLTECPTCTRPTRVVHVEYPGEEFPTGELVVEDVMIDPSPSLHGDVRITDLASASARVEEIRSPALYRRHAETCRGGN